jgi:hypothetical protein
MAYWAYQRRVALSQLHIRVFSGGKFRSVFQALLSVISDTLAFFVSWRRTTRHQASPIHDIVISPSMSRFLKKKRTKKPSTSLGLPAQNVTPSTSTVTSVDQTDIALERLDWAELVANILYDISEASPILGPLKATSALLIRGLETARVISLVYFLLGRRMTCLLEH